ncbi:hypothetical protein E2C01_003190 [Portunus trituberculatus]|uniref:Uncharacterized protein n=1 Tax=Portunus trituberculatus TaxID=210409 RepID=A0A5B7CSV9_PORTR|nr:hypothetical protein [Portunus trituberculatus]
MLGVEFLALKYTYFKPTHTHSHDAPSVTYTDKCLYIRVSRYKSPHPLVRARKNPAKTQSSGGEGFLPDWEGKRTQLPPGGNVVSYGSGAEL